MLSLALRFRHSMRLSILKSLRALKFDKR